MYTSIMSKTPILQLDNVTKKYGPVLAIEDISFSIHQGEVVGLVGLNGSGKSTMINLLMGFLRPNHGELTLFNRPILPETAHKVHQKVGFATGDMSLFSNLTGKQYLAFLKRAYKIKNDKRIKELCAQFDPQLNKKIGDLSRGNKQKIALIAAFMASPELVILDEPSSGLDPFMQQTFLDLVNKEAVRGTTIFMSSHYLTEVADVCSRVLFMREGQLVKDVSAQQLESMNGKMVRVVTKQVVRPPKTAELVSHKRVTGGYELSFIYKDSSTKLQKWLTDLPQLIDFNVNEHDIESAFSDLYIGSKIGEHHV